jgi:hypothetical protein
MPDVEDDNDEALLIDLVENAPLPGEASTVDAGELFHRAVGPRVADSRAVAL